MLFFKKIQLKTKGIAESVELTAQIKTATGVMISTLCDETIKIRAADAVSNPSEAAIIKMIGMTCFINLLYLIC